MGTNIAVTSESFDPGDQSWLANRDGLDVMRTITVDPSLFDADHVIKGKIPSGTVLAKCTSGPSSGYYGPYDPGTQVNESGSLVATGGSAGDFTLSFDGEKTVAIAYNASAADVLAALEGLSNIDVGDVAVTGGPLPTTPVVITLKGQYADRNVSDITVTDENVTDGNAVITITQGGGSGAASDGRETTDNLGHLFADIKVTALATDPKVGAALYWRGIVRESRLPNFAGGANGVGELDSAAKAALIHIRYE